MTRLTLHRRGGATVSSPGLPDVPLDPGDPSAILAHLDDVVALADGMTALAVAEALEPWNAAVSAVSRTDLAAWRRATSAPTRSVVLSVCVRPVLHLMRGSPGRRHEAAAVLGWRPVARVSGREDEVPLFDLDAAEWGPAPLYLEESASVVDGPAAFTGQGTLARWTGPGAPSLRVVPTLHATLLRGLFGDVILGARPR